MDGPNTVQTPLTVQHACEVIPLRQLGKGRLGQLHAMDLCCEDCELLQAMGMTDQCKIRMCRRGSSCIVQVGATRLGVSARFAERILVRPIVSAT
jgi:Fe2+ transport system protein FeoA